MKQRANLNAKLQVETRHRHEAARSQRATIETFRPSTVVVLKLSRGGRSALTPTFTVALAASCITGSSRYRSFLRRRTAGKQETKARGGNEEPAEVNDKAGVRVQFLCKTLFLNSASFANSWVMALAVTLA